MKDLLSHCQHPNVSMRKDSLLGMIELLDRYDYLAVQQLSTITRTTVKMILDMDRSVRKVLLQLYATHYSRLDEVRPRSLEEPRWDAHSAAIVRSPSSGRSSPSSWCTLARE